LRNLIFRISCLADATADYEHLPEPLRPDAAKDKERSDGGPETIDIDTASLSDFKRAASDEAEKQFLEQGLQQVAGRVAELARRVNMNRSHLQTLLKKHGIRSKDYRATAAKTPTQPATGTTEAGA
jgi:DNA-binding NtrC family response regulator